MLGVDAMSPATAEAAGYECAAQMWRVRGCDVGGAAERSFGGIPVQVT